MKSLNKDHRKRLPRGVAVLGLVLLFPLTSACSATLSEAMVVSVAEDGQHVISSHREGELVLWDVARRSYEVVSTQANSYSAHFVPGRDAFLWQDLDDVVRVSTIDGREVLAFDHFPTYGHLIDEDLETYVAADEGWGIHLGHGEEQQVLKPTDGRAFLGFGKLLNLQLDADSDRLLSAGYGYFFDERYSVADEWERERYKKVHGVAVWDLADGDLAFKLPGNSAKTHATLSPDGKYVVSVDENSKSFTWRVATGELWTRTADFGFGLFVGGHPVGSLKNWSTDGMHLDVASIPQDLKNGAQLGVHFLSDDHFVILQTDQPYAMLYELGDAFAHAIMDLGTDPFPATNSYARNAAIDTAPEANLLVTGQRSGGGINVYRFDPERQTLERIWVPEPG